MRDKMTRTRKKGRGVGTCRDQQKGPLSGSPVFLAGRRGFEPRFTESELSQPDKNTLALVPSCVFLCELPAYLTPCNVFLNRLIFLCILHIRFTVKEENWGDIFCKVLTKGALMGGVPGSIHPPWVTIFEGVCCRHTERVKNGH